MLPPSLVIFAMLVDKLDGKLRALVIRLALGATFLLGVGLSVSDLIWARAERSIPAMLEETGIKDGYFVGHFGFQYYMERKGFIPLEVSVPLKGPVNLIAAKMPDPQKPCRETMDRMDLTLHTG